MVDKDIDAHFQPWLGSEYHSKLLGQKILILGESHYHDCATDKECASLDTKKREDRHTQLTRQVVTFWKDNPHRSPLSYRLPKIFDIDKPSFWEGVVFYNYLQSFAGRKPRERPTEQQWDDYSATAFQQVLDAFNPDRILVLGKKLWSIMPSKTPFLVEVPEREVLLPVLNDVRGYGEVDRDCYWYFSKSGHRALAMPIMHPSAPKFRIEEWRAPIKLWMGFRS